MPPASATIAPKPAVNLALEQQEQQAAARASGSPRYTGEPISVNLKDVDLKDFFRLIHDISGLNVVLDPNVKGSLTLVLDDVPWDQALDIVLQNNGLDRATARATYCASRPWTPCGRRPKRDAPRPKRKPWPSISRPSRISSAMLTPKT